LRERRSMLSYDDGLMYCAVSDNRYARARDTGFINRVTGEIVFVYDDEEDAEALGGRYARAAAVFARAAVEASPDQWIGIPRRFRLPRFHEHWCDVRLTRGRGDCNCPAKDRKEEDADEFIARFLREHGLR
jgi:hypothetical protein